VALSLLLEVFIGLLPRNALASSDRPAALVGMSRRLLPYLQPVIFSLGQVICEPGERIDCCYFPMDNMDWSTYRPCL